MTEEEKQAKERQLAETAAQLQITKEEAYEKEQALKRSEEDRQQQQRLRDMIEQQRQEEEAKRRHAEDKIMEQEAQLEEIRKKEEQQAEERQQQSHELETREDIDATKDTDRQPHTELKKDRLKLLGKELEEKRDSAKKTKTDIQYGEIKEDKYKTLKNIRKGNTIERVTLFEQL